MAENEKNQSTLSHNKEEEGTLPPKKSLEERIEVLEAASEENRGYLQRILSLLSKGAKEIELATPGSHQQEAKKIPAETSGKKPLQITVIDDKERYSYKPDEPGLLAHRPDMMNKQNSTPLPQQKLKMKMEEHHTLETTTSPMYNFRGLSLRPKIELTMFDGSNPRGWVKKCQKYFSLLEIPEEQKVDLAAMHLEGKAETWFDGYIMQKHRFTWQEFVSDLCHRFCDRTYSDIIEEFNKLAQKGNVEEYQEKFEELRPYMIQQSPYLDELYFVSNFISGLKEEIRHRVKVNQPRTLNEAYRQAKLHELSIEIETKRSRPAIRTNTYSTQPNPQKTYNPTTFNPQKTTNQNFNQNPTKQALLDYRRTNNLCYKCGDRFTPGHQCKLKQLNLMEEETDLEEQEAATEEFEGDTTKEEKNRDEGLEISINALTGSVGHSTLRIQGSIKGRPLNILIYSGSTHSFINPGWAKEGADTIPTQPLVITVANGEKLLSLAKVKQLL
ncbi:hypothetical protein GQ457_14G021280 [Hibiscus cannabinus]